MDLRENPCRVASSGLRQAQCGTDDHELLTHRIPFFVFFWRSSAPCNLSCLELGAQKHFMGEGEKKKTFLSLTTESSSHAGWNKECDYVQRHLRWSFDFGTLPLRIAEMTSSYGQFNSLSKPLSSTWRLSTSSGVRTERKQSSLTQGLLKTKHSVNTAVLMHGHLCSLPKIKIINTRCNTHVLSSGGYYTEILYLR